MGIPADWPDNAFLTIEEHLADDLLGDINTKKTRKWLLEQDSDLSKVITDNMSSFYDSSEEATSFKEDYSLFDRIKQLGKKRRAKIEKIEANTGDDNAVVSSNIDFHPLGVAISAHILGVVISWPDVGNSDATVNYAEQWIMLPLSAYSGFDYTRTATRGVGVPWTMDTPKLRLLSCARKQSDMDMDLKSKYPKIHQNANFVDNHWISYDDNQMMKLIATAIFDFRRGRSFPFLSRAEGGCGGQPPWNQIATAISGMHFFNKGKSKRGLAGLVCEANQIHEGTKSLRDCYFLPAVRLASAGDQVWKKIASQALASQEAGLSLSDIRELLREEDSIPDDLKDFSYEVDVESRLLAGAISYLRTNGFIKTELDVILLQQSLEREAAVLGEVPMYNVLNDLKERKLKMMEEPHRIFSYLLDATTESDEEICEILRLTEDLYTEEFWANLSNYYDKLGKVKLSTISYTPQLRLFKAQDVVNYYKGGDHEAWTDSIGLHTRNFPLRVTTEPAPGPDRDRKERLSNWFESTVLQKVVEGPIPSDVGPADGLLIHNIIHTLRQAKEDEPGRRQLAIAVTRDGDLKASIPHYAEDIAIVSPHQYLRWCLLSSRKGVTALNRVKNALRLSKSKFFNIITQRQDFIPLEAVGDILQGLDRSRKHPFIDRHARNQRTKIERRTQARKVLREKAVPIRAHFFYDVANIVGTLMHFQIKEKANRPSIAKLQGGIIGVDRASDPYFYCESIKSIKEQIRAGIRSTPGHIDPQRSLVYSHFT